MAPRSGPSITTIALSLAGIALGVTLAIFGIGTAAGFMAAAPTVQAPTASGASFAAAKVVSTASAATTRATEQRPVTSAEPPKAATVAVAKATPAPKKKPAAKPPVARPVRVVKPKPKPHVAALPDRLKTLGNARQVVVVTAAEKSDRDGTLALYNRTTGGNWIRVMSATTRLGKNALVSGSARHQGSSTTPTGSWAMPAWGFGKAAAAPHGSRLGWKKIKSTSYWCSEQGSRYNTWVSSSSGVSGERLIKYADQSYEFAIDSGYNSAPNPRVYGRGTAIFIHCMHPGYTAGCISIPRDKMIALLKALDPARHPRCVIGTTDKGSPTSIWAY